MSWSPEKSPACSKWKKQVDSRKLMNIKKGSAWHLGQGAKTWIEARIHVTRRKAKQKSRSRLGFLQQHARTLQEDSEGVERRGSLSQQKREKYLRIYRRSTVKSEISLPLDAE